MKVTRQMIDAFKTAWHEQDALDTQVPGARSGAGIQAVLDLLPDVEPFTFTGYPDNPVYLHKCGTVVDVSPVSKGARAEVDAGECDCENTSPWMRIYVERAP